MPRPQKYRKIDPSFTPPSRLFRPHKNQDYERIFVTREELEALRLRYYDKKEDDTRRTQNEASEMMGISQTTYSRILNRAFKKITKALVEGKAIAIQHQFGKRGRKFRHGQGFGPANMKESAEESNQGQHEKGTAAEQATTFNQGGPQAYWNKINRPFLQTDVVFDGFGCLECGFQFEKSEIEDEEKLGEENDQKPECPNCKSPKVYRLKKKGPKKSDTPYNQ